MPGLFKKKVRFANTKYMQPATHTPATPALTVGSLSPASSGGPTTPPNVAVSIPGYYYSPPKSYDGYNYPVVPQQPQYHQQQPIVNARISASPLMIPTPHHSTTTSSSTSHSSRSSMRIQPHPYLEASSRHPRIHWNLQDHPSLASRHNYTLSSTALLEPATNPALSSLTIFFHSPIPTSWAFTVVPSSRGTYVTLNDVLQAIYAQLRINAGHKDFERLKSRSEQKEVSSAYEGRYRRYRAQDMYTQEKSGGMKRVDFLGRRTTFLGLEGTERPDVWKLNTG